MEKKFSGYLILNWKTGDVRYYKSKPVKSRITPFQIPIKVDITLEVPEPKEHKINGKITVPEQKVSEMVVESI